MFNFIDIKCERDFWEYYFKNRKFYKTQSLSGGELSAKIRFVSFSISEMWGVFVDFFDEKGIQITARRELGEMFNFKNDFMWCVQEKSNNFREHGHLEDLKSCRMKAIEKASEIYETINNS